MPLNTTDQEIRIAAANDLAEKLKLERRQIIELRELFRNMSADMFAFISETGNAPSASVYEDDLRGILAKQGRRTSTAFSGQVTDFLEEAPDDESIIEELAVIAAISGLSVADVVAKLKNDVRVKNQAFVADQVSRDTQFITRTNQKEMDAAVASATASIIQDGRAPTNAEVARIASRDFKNRGFARSPTIAATFTQKIAEGVKDIERNAFFDARNGVQAVVVDLPQIEEKEIWITVGDELVRSSHIAADFTEKQGNVWIVQGEPLRFPGDPNGSASNIINCRCSATIVIESEVVASTPRVSPLRGRQSGR